jgi:hypothetical protein
VRQNQRIADEFYRFNRQRDMLSVGPSVRKRSLSATFFEYQTMNEMTYAVESPDAPRHASWFREAPTAGMQGAENGWCGESG